MLNPNQNQMHISLAAVVVIAIGMVAPAAAATTADDADCSKLKSSFGDGHSVDLTPLAANDVQMPFPGGRQLYFNLCHKLKSLPGGQTASLRAYLTAAANSSSSSDSSRSIQLAQSTGRLLHAPDSQQRDGVSLELSDGEACPNTSSQQRSLWIYFECSSAEVAPSYLFDNQCTFAIKWPTRQVCSGSNGNNNNNNDNGQRMGWFSIMLLSCLIGFMVYIVVGVFYKRSQGYRGWEQLPHHEGWQSLLDRVRNIRGGVRLPGGASTGGGVGGYRRPGGVGDYQITLVDDDELFSE